MVALDFPDTPTVGQIYDKWTWNGTQWVLTSTSPSGGVNDPWGIIGKATYSAADQAIPAAETPLHGASCNFPVTIPANRLVRFGMHCNLTGGPTVAYFRVYYAAVMKYLWSIDVPRTSSPGLQLTSPPIAVPAGAPAQVTYTVQYISGSGLTVTASTFQATTTWAEDVGHT